MTTMAAIDRVVHHSVILDLMGMDSYRAREASDHHARPPDQPPPERLHDQPRGNPQFPFIHREKGLGLTRSCGHLKKGDTCPDGVRLNGQALEAAIYGRVQS
jgi:hypothetical protein